MKLSPSFATARLGAVLAAHAAWMLPVISLAVAQAQDDKSANAPFEPKACSLHVTPAPANVADDPDLAPRVRKLLVQLDKDPSPFWTLPQPKPQEILTELQNQTKVDVSGVTTTEHTLTVDGRTVQLFVMKPDRMEERPALFCSCMAAFGLSNNFENHKRLLRDLVSNRVSPRCFVLFLTSPAYAELGPDLEKRGLSFAHTQTPTAVLLPDGSHAVLTMDRKANVAAFEQLAAETPHLTFAAAGMIRFSDFFWAAPSSKCTKQ